MLTLLLALLSPAHAEECDDLWDFDAVRARWAWARADTRGLGAPVIGVVEPGFRAEHIDLAGRVEATWDFTLGVEEVAPVQGPLAGQGTAVAGVLVAADNAEGRTGVAPEGRVALAQVATEAGVVRMTAVAEAMLAFAAGDHGDVGVVVTSVSTDDSSRTLQEAVVALEDADIVLVVAAGDCADCAEPDLSAAPRYPVAYASPHLIAVAASDRDDALAPTSRYSARLVHLAAPGVDICSLGEESPNAIATGSGTALAAAFVAGAVALLREAMPMLTAPEIVALVQATALPVPALDGLVRTGARLDVDRALQAAVPLLDPPLAALGELSIVVTNPGLDGDATLVVQHHDEVALVEVLEPEGWSVAPVAPGDAVPQTDGVNAETSQPGALLTGPLPAGDAVTVRVSVRGTAPGTATVRVGASSLGAAWMPGPIQGETVDAEGNPALEVQLDPLPFDAEPEAEPRPKVEDPGCAVVSAAPAGALTLAALLLGLRRRDPAA